jgi:hypothetical protein
MYLDRIAVPHAALDETLSSLSAFMTKYDPQEYETTMADSSKVTVPVRKQLSEREAFEQSLVRFVFDTGSFHYFGCRIQGNGTANSNAFVTQGYNWKQRRGIY